ncbi:MAG: hypothetical protein OXL39_08150 [Caldilineaceae bacterium]|nr:hypothetical protein [Caldilineaceae bacterium]MDE0181304.1 hypothetical protein [Caldilineaceae bacterium]MDE0431732.1 hypothetical protein [Caldilineaceae bacterium]
MVDLKEFVDLLGDIPSGGSWLILLILLWRRKDFQRILDHALRGSIELIRLTNMIGQIVMLLLIIFVKFLDLLSRFDDGEPPES